MSIDDPLEAGKSVLAAEKRAESPVTPFLKALAPLVPGVLGNLFRGLLQRKKDENLKFMFTVMQDELDRVRNVVEQRTPSEGQVECVCEDWWGLVEDGFRRAEQTRAKDRIARIARILVNSLIQEPSPEPDDVEEMMRIAMDLSDRDVVALRIVDEVTPSRHGLNRPSLYQALQFWKGVPWRVHGFSDSDIESTCSKLASFGLLARLDIQPNQNVHTSDHNGYELLDKGRSFIHFIRSNAG